MLNLWQKRDVAKILERFGNNAQEHKTIEELSELIRAIARQDRENVLEELADVYIMLEQLRKIYCIDPHDLCKTVDHKLLRVKEKYGKI